MRIKPKCINPNSLDRNEIKVFFICNLVCLHVCLVHEQLQGTTVNGKVNSCGDGSIY